MLKARLITGICLCFWAIGSAAQSLFPSGFEGLWSGNGVQISGRNWTIELELNSDHALVQYPRFGCGGRWEYAGQGAQHLSAVETLGFGADRCTNGLEIRLCARDPSTIVGLWYFENTTEPFAAAVLHSLAGAGQTDQAPVQMSLEALSLECGGSTDFLGS